MNPKKKNPAHQQLGNPLKKTNNTSSSAQRKRKRILDWLHERPLTTVEARDQLNVMAPAARIFELRHNCRHEIVMKWIAGYDSSGRKHRMAQYALLSEKNKDSRNG